MDNMIKKEDILSYGYYDESGKYVVVIDRQKLGKIYGADRVIFQECYGLDIINEENEVKGK